MKEILKFCSVMIYITLLVGCEPSGNTKNINQLNEIKNETVSSKFKYLDSIKGVGSQIAYLNSSLDYRRSEINRLIKQKDSIKNLVNQIESALTKLKSDKLDPGVSGVNAKLNELKGKKENFHEQLVLQKEEIDLAEKKIELLKEEKLVYDAQKQALWDKGAAPAEFKNVDSLLAKINIKSTEQKYKLKNLNRSISEINEQTAIIDEQRRSLSKKIRENYSAQEIFDDYSKEEKDRLTMQLVSIDEQLKNQLVEESELNNELALRSGEKKYLENKQSSIIENEKTLNSELEITQNQLQIKADEKKSRLNIAFIAIGITTILLVLLYIVGKKRKHNRTKNSKQ